MRKINISDKKYKKSNLTRNKSFICIYHNLDMGSKNAAVGSIMAQTVFKIVCYMICVAMATV